MDYLSENNGYTKVIDNQWNIFINTNMSYPLHSSISNKVSTSTILTPSNNNNEILNNKRFKRKQKRIT